MYSFRKTNIAVKGNGRLLVTSDIHGHSEHLRAILKKADFRENDLLLIVGDMLDKGPDSLGTLRLIIKLCAEGRAVAMMGNVDYLRLASIKYTIENRDNTQNFLDYINYMNSWKGTCFYKELFNEIGVEPSSVDVINEYIEKVWEHFKAEFDFIASLPTVIETNKYIFVHGGIPEGEKAFYSTPDSEKDALSYLKADAFRDRAAEKGLRFSKHIVCGHWPVLNYGGGNLCCNPYFCEDTNIISIDGGCGIAKEGQLNLLAFPAVDCEPTDIALYTFDTLETVIACEEQQASENPFSVSWPENEVRLLSFDKDIAFVEHIASGRQIYITASSLWRDASTLSHGDVSRIRQSTDFRLPVSIGDSLSVIQKTSIGILAKKNGVTGWYYGRYK